MELPGTAPGSEPLITSAFIAIDRIAPNVSYLGFGWLRCKGCEARPERLDNHLIRESSKEFAMKPETLDRLRAAFAVLADESRLRIIGLIAQRAHSVEELAALLALKEPTVSHHLNRLKALDLVTMERQGNTHLYRLDGDVLRSIQKSVFALGEPSQVSAAIAPNAFDDKVLAAFFDGEQLVSIPSGRKKRIVVLRRLIEGFDEGRDYPEAEVNAVLKRAHEDVATLRREFIMNGMMTRENGIYTRRSQSEWRVEDGSPVRA